MAQFLANRIKGGHLTIGEVPESLKEQEVTDQAVQELILATMKMGV